jgi:hypothetical protein
MFFSSSIREYSAKTVSVSHILILPRNEFIKVIKRHQEDYVLFFLFYCLYITLFFRKNFVQLGMKLIFIK